MKSINNWSQLKSQGRSFVAFRFDALDPVKPQTSQQLAAEWHKMKPSAPKIPKFETENHSNNRINKWNKSLTSAAKAKEKQKKVRNRFGVRVEFIIISSSVDRIFGSREAPELDPTTALCYRIVGKKVSSCLSCRLRGLNVSLVLFFSGSQRMGGSGGVADASSFLLRPKRPCFSLRPQNENG